jgi:hypothetical protein
MAAFQPTSQRSGNVDQNQDLMSMLGPHSIDHLVRQAISLCWSLLPPERRTADEVSKQVRRIVDRALANLNEDQNEFGRPGEPASSFPSRPSVPNVG